MIGNGVFADSLANALADQGIDVERAESAVAATTADVLLPDVLVLAADAAHSRGAAVLTQLQANDSTTPTLVICAKADASLAPPPAPKHVAHVTAEGGVSDCARRVRALLNALIEDPSSGTSFQKLADKLAGGAVKAPSTGATVTGQSKTSARTRTLQGVSSPPKAASAGQQKLHVTAPPSASASNTLPAKSADTGPTKTDSRETARPSASKASDLNETVRPAKPDPSALFQAARSGPSDLNETSRPIKLSLKAPASTQSTPRSLAPPGKPPAPLTSLKPTAAQASKPLDAGSATKPGAVAQPRKGAPPVPASATAKAGNTTLAGTTPANAAIDGVKAAAVAAPAVPATPPQAAKAQPAISPATGPKPSTTVSLSPNAGLPNHPPALPNLGQAAAAKPANPSRAMKKTLTGFMPTSQPAPAANDVEHNRPQPSAAAQQATRIAPAAPPSLPSPARGPASPADRPQPTAAAKSTQQVAALAPRQAEAPIPANPGAAANAQLIKQTAPLLTRASPAAVASDDAPELKQRDSRASVLEINVALSEPPAAQPPPKQQSFVATGPSATPSQAPRLPLPTADAALPNAPNVAARAPVAGAAAARIAQHASATTTQALGPSATPSRAPRNPLDAAARAADPSINASPNIVSSVTPARAPRQSTDAEQHARANVTSVSSRAPRYPFEPAPSPDSAIPANENSDRRLPSGAPRDPFAPAARAAGPPPLAAKTTGAIQNLRTGQLPALPLEPAPRTPQQPPSAAVATQRRTGQVAALPFQPAAPQQPLSAASLDDKTLSLRAGQAATFPEAALTSTAKPRKPRGIWVLGAIAAIGCSAGLVYLTFDRSAAKAPGNPAAGSLVQTPALTVAHESAAPAQTGASQAPEQTPNPQANNTTERATTGSTGGERRTPAPSEPPDTTTRTGRAKALVDEGTTMSRQGRLGLAEGMYMKALVEVPEYPAALAELVRVHLARKDGTEAVRWAERLVSKQDAAVSQLLLGDAQALRGNSSAAEAAWTKAARAGNATARKRLADSEEEEEE